MKLGKSRLVKDVIKQVVDKETGEIIEQGVEKHFVSEVKTENFFMVFIENIAPFLGLKQAADMRLIACMCCIADYNTGIVHMTRKAKRDLCEKANISISNISRNLNRLMEVGLITEDDGDFTINPSVFWKGTTKTRTEFLQTGGMTFQITLIEPKS